MSSTPAQQPAPRTDLGVRAVIIYCRTEAEQRALYEECRRAARRCRLVRL